MMKKIAHIISTFALLSVAASAATIWNTSVGVGNLAGSRSGSDLVTSSNWSAMEISWNIVETDGTYEYTYSFSGPARPGLSHFILELSENCTALNSSSDPCFVGSEGKYEGPESWSRNPADLDFPLNVTIWGVKLDFGGDFDDDSVVTYTFESNRAPVWGNFFAKGGNDDFAYNVALGISGFESMNSSYFIARPDTDTTIPGGDEIPEPSTYALIGGSLLGLAMLRRKA